MPGSVDYDDYDSGSITYYPRWLFSSNDQEIIVPRRPGVTIGERTGPLCGDLQMTAKIYERFFTKGQFGRLVW